MFIPYINFFLIYVWLYHYMRNSDADKMTFIRKFFCGLLIAFLINLPRILLSFVIDSSSINALLFHITIYFSVLVIGYIAIKDQINYQKDKMK